MNLQNEIELNELIARVVRETIREYESHSLGASLLGNVTLDHKKIQDHLRLHPEWKSQIEWCIEHIGATCCQAMSDRHTGTPFEFLMNELKENSPVMLHYHFMTFDHWSKQCGAIEWLV